MKRNEKFRKIAILMDKTGYELADVYGYINSADTRLPVNTTGLSKNKIKILDKAMKEMTQDGEYSLAKEYGMISTMMFDMDDQDFEETDPELYREADRYFHELIGKIMDECVKHYSDLCKDIISDGKITDGYENTAVYRWMLEHKVEWDC